MPNAAESYRLVVSGLMGTVYIAKLTKQPHIMSQTRRKVPESEFIDAILQYTLSKLEENSDTLQITLNGNVEAEIVIKNKKLLTRE